MSRKKILIVHIIATLVALITITSFFSFSFWAEMFGSQQDTKMVKTGIVYALPLLLIAMPILGISGNKLAGKSSNPIITEKKKRMKWVFINGLILITIAITLFLLARSNNFGSTFLGLQLLELALGFINLILIGFNIRTGLKLSGRI